MGTFDLQTKSSLVSNMAVEASEMETFPVLIGNEIAHFHDVGGGYSTRYDAHIVNLIHRVQEVGSPYRVSPDNLAQSIELHLEHNYYNLQVDSIRRVNEYPERDYILSLKVNGYQKGEYSFNEEMSTQIDRRETRFDY